MKVSIVISVVVLAVAAWLGSIQGNRIRTAQQTKTRLMVRAKHLEIPLNPESSADRTKISNRQQTDRRQDIHALAVRLTQLFQLSPKDRASAASEISAQLELLSSLNTDEFIELLSALRAGTTNKECWNYVFYAFSRIHPRGMLEYLAEFPGELAEGSATKQNVLNGAVAMWSIDDPAAALEWYRKNKDKSADFATRSGIILNGVSYNDPKLAFSLLSEFGLTPEYIPSIMSCARESHQLDALAALREHFKSLGNSEADEQLFQKAIQSLGGNVSRKDFASAREWINNAKLTPSELKGFARGLNEDSLKPGETGRWIEWIGECLPEDEGSEKINKLFGQWVTEDYQAAGKWLDTLPDGAARNSSIRSYAETVTRHDPQTAAKWALMLPPGKQRDDILESIYHNWPGTDEEDDGNETSRAAAEAFARQHHIQSDLPESDD